ncbi:MAG: NUDIX domain-containing protein [Candidatus Saccharimonadales bacterium]|jgi:8-oxo-dGTP pyrophosphatase MutT (NUDIX family)
MKRPNPIKGFRKFVHRRPAINEVVREPTAGGIIFRRAAGSPTIDILLIQDSRGRWTIPKGHIEETEKASETAQREIREEVGLQEMKVLDWLGKINFRYRRDSSLVLMTTEIFLVQALGNTDKVRPEKWMKGLEWLPANEALEKIEYEDIGKLILLGLKKIRKHNL